MMKSSFGAFSESINPHAALSFDFFGCRSAALQFFFAFIGIIIPGWPTVSWLVLAAYCFARSSQKLFRWLLTNRMFGPILLEYYRSGRALPFHSKMVICTVICVASGASIWGITEAGDPGFGQTLIVILALIGVWWVGWKVPTSV
jgi:uncharacterized membrane protein YbaN (DUF454 family)